MHSLVGRVVSCSFARAPLLHRHNVRCFSVLSRFATIDPKALSGTERLQNLVNGQWVDPKSHVTIKDPMTGRPMVNVPSTQEDELEPYVSSMARVPKSGCHNVYKSPERFLLYGDIHRKVAETLHDPEVFDFFVTAVQRVMPKSRAQAEGEVAVVRKFFENFSGDNVRLMMRGFVQAGDHGGQRSVGYRWPYGPVAVISPFNFPLEIPVMQFMSAAMVGNKPVVKPESRVGLPVEQFLRLLHYCGLPKDDVDLINCSGSVMSVLLMKSGFRVTQFTGGATTAEIVTDLTKGKVRLEDAGFDWKLLGPDSSAADSVDYVAWQCDQDAYALSGQKCSAQSVALVHDDWVNAGLLTKMEELAQRRSLNDMTLSPLLSHTTADVEAHLKAVLAIPGSKLLFGGKPLTDHTIPEEFGAFAPTAVLVDLNSALSSKEHFAAVTRELFGPFQIVIKWSNEQEEKVLNFLERMDAHLTAAVVSRDPQFLNYILGNTVNGTTYAGLRARTTGAPQNHWFGCAGSPLAAGIGTPEAVLTTWTCHREVIYDEGPIPGNWSLPPPS